jgi:hypothetical protein
MRVAMIGTGYVGLVAPRVAAQMAHSISTIAKAECETQTTHREDSVLSTITPAASSIAPCGEMIDGIPALRKKGVTGKQDFADIDAYGVQRWLGELALALRKESYRPALEFTDPILHAPLAGSQSSALVPELSPIAPSAAPAVADVAVLRMPSGIGGFNIDPPAPRASPVGRDIAISDMRARLLLKPEPVQQWPIQRPKAIAGIDELSLVFNLMAIIAIVGLALLAFRGDGADKQVRDPPRAVIPMHEGGLSGAATSAHPALVVTESQKGFANEPIPLGIWLKNGSGGETVTIDGLAKGTDLSLGTWQGQAGWLLPARDLDKTFVGPPRDFVGVMDAAVKLSSASGQLLESQIIRLEWIEKREQGLQREESLSPALAPAELDPTPVVPPLNSEQIATLIKLGEDLLEHGDIATARLVLKRAAIAGNAQAALELGLTFDQTFLSVSGRLGVLPDAAQARVWYERAIKLGSTEALGRLQR